MLPVNIFKRYHIKFLIICAVGLLTCGCYFNSAGHIFSRASYNATANTVSIQPGSTAYRDSDGNYYIELPRYRKEKKIPTQYSIFEETQRPVLTKDMNDTTLFQISQEYAMYLTGQRSSMSSSAYTFVPQKNADKIKKSADRLSIVRWAEPFSIEYRYDSPNAVWFYTAGVFDWLCVDLPITCVENSLLIVGVISGKLIQGVGKAAVRGATYASSYEEFKRKYPCPTCHGTGLVSSTYVKYNGFGNQIGSDNIATHCPDCSDGLSPEGRAALNEYVRNSID